MFAASILVGFNTISLPVQYWVVVVPGLCGTNVFPHAINANTFVMVIKTGAGFNSPYELSSRHFFVMGNYCSHFIS